MIRIIILTIYQLKFLLNIFFNAFVKVNMQRSMLVFMFELDQFEINIIIVMKCFALAIGINNKKKRRETRFFLEVQKR